MNNTIKELTIKFKFDDETTTEEDLLEYFNNLVYPNKDIINWEKVE